MTYRQTMDALPCCGRFEPRPTPPAAIAIKAVEATVEYPDHVSFLDALKARHR